MERKWSCVDAVRDLQRIRRDWESSGWLPARSGKDLWERIFSKERSKRIRKSLFLCGSLAIFASIIQLFPSLEIQLATMIAISFYRAFLLGATAAYMNLAFPAEHFGRLYGLTRLSAALCVLFVPVFYDFVLSKGDFDISSYFFIFALSTGLLQSFNLYF